MTYLRSSISWASPTIHLKPHLDSINLPVWFACYMLRPLKNLTKSVLDLTLIASFDLMCMCDLPVFRFDHLVISHNPPSALYLDSVILPVLARVSVNAQMDVLRP